MASQEEIVNRALVKIGAATIANINDSTKSARAMAAIWNSVLASETRRYNWNFAMCRALLPALATPPAYQFALAYQLPADYLRLVQVGDIYQSPSMTDYRTMDDSPYAIERGQILTDLTAPLKIRYVGLVTNPGQFDPLFDEVMASKLGYEACESINQSKDKKDDCLRDYKAALGAASMADAIEKPPEGNADDSWMLVRL